MAKIGETHASGMARKGLSEVAQYLPAFNTAGTHVTEDPAIWPNQTQGEIAQARGSYGLDAEQEKPQPVTLEGLRARGQESRQGEHSQEREEHEMQKEHGRGH